MTGDPPHCGPPAEYKDEMNTNTVLNPIVSMKNSAISPRIFYSTHYCCLVGTEFTTAIYTAIYWGKYLAQ